MGRKVSENVDSKRELLYSFSTLVFTPVLYYFAVTSPFSKIGTPQGLSSPQQSHEHEDGYASTHLFPEEKTVANDQSADRNNFTGESDYVISFIVEHRELPFETVFYVILFEIFKLLIVFTVFPGSHLFDQTPSLANSVWNLPSLGNAGGAGLALSSKNSQGRLPFSKRDRDNVPSKAPTFQTKVLELWKGFCNYAVGCVICHMLVVLLGAPIIQDCKVTFQFSIILTTWLFSPMCLSVQPSQLLHELMFISLWSSENEILHRTKWRFAITVVGAWAGAVVIPLDWDRPWQKWPIPCLCSTAFTFLTSNLVLAIHLFCTIFGIYHKLYLLTTESSKIKNF